ncbi:cysteine desulfurase / selenocysteine lyase [Ekhidna lutea]|uniref:Cysteine desulfurase n=1 Tax=Ekhidna lutea TaxID=447679 RepID=A0A239M1N8_EKHLU|nr:cysteine desulfurase [Ekhidna lutea]SNT35884.1 cysteine desulfurase / selenocysteine lyase [Ekhidna lutea]
MGTAVSSLDIQKIREQFPVLNQEVNGKPLVYFDNAASSQTAKRVVDSLIQFYEKDHANIHRGIHTLAERSTKGFEATRERVHQFINSAEADEIVFTKGTTESINLVAQSWGSKFLNAGDEILISQLEHHSNIVPWQMAAERTGAVIRVIPINDKGEILMDEYKKLLNSKTKLVAINYISNSLGTINPVKEMIAAAQEVNATTLIDAAQAAPHIKIDVQELNCDFLALSSHKMYGPTGVGVLYGRRDVLESMPPYQGGGEMIKDVSFSGTTYNDIPYKFEAGTPNIGEVIAFKYAMDFIDELGHENIQAYEHELLEYANSKLATIPGFRPIGTSDKKASVISFLIENVHQYDLGQFLDVKGIAVRTGHHCTQPLMDFLKIDGTVRASFAVYNTKEEIDVFCDALENIVKKFS